jgi:hypothetical protein
MLMTDNERLKILAKYQTRKIGFKMNFEFFFKTKRLRIQRLLCFDK